MIPTALLPQTASIEPYEGESATGPVFDLAESYPARVEAKRHWLNPGAGGTTVLSDAVCYLRPDAVVQTGDRLTCDGVVYRVLSVSVVREQRRVSHLEATLGRTET